MGFVGLLVLCMGRRLGFACRFGECCLETAFFFFAVNSYLGRVVMRDMETSGVRVYVVWYRRCCLEASLGVAIWIPSWWLMRGFARRHSRILRVRLVDRVRDGSRRLGVFGLLTGSRFYGLGGRGILNLGDSYGRARKLGRDLGWSA